MFGGGSNTQYTLGFTVALRDRFSKQATSVKNAITGLKDENRAFNQNLQNARNLYGGIAVAGGVALGQMSGWVREGAKFSYIMKGVKAVSRSTADEYSRLMGLANTLGQRTMFMPEDIASGMRYMAMAGQDANTILKTITQATNLAGATMTQLGGKLGAADILTNVLKGFQLASSHANRVADVLATATTHANVSLVDLGNSLKYVSATSVDLGVGVETTTALAMALGNAGIQGSMAGTALENMYRYLAMGLSEFRTNRQSKAWAALGLNPKDVMDAYGNLLPIEKVLGKIGENLKGNGTVKIQGILKEIFGVRGKRAGSAVIRMMDDFERFQDTLKNNSVGNAQRIMSSMMDELEGDILKLISTFKSVKIAYSQAMAPVIRPILGFLKGVLSFGQRIMKNPVGKFFAIFTTGAIAVLTLNAAIRAVIASFGLMWRSGLGSLTAINSALGLAVRGMTGLGTATAGTGLAAAMGTTFAGKTSALQPGQKLKFSDKRQMYYTHGGGQRTRWLPKGTTPATGRGMGVPMFFGRMAGGLGKILGVLGPIGMAAMIFLPLLSPILDKIKANFEETRRMANYLRDKDKNKASAMFSNQEVLSVLGQKSLAELVQLFKDAKGPLSELYGMKEAIKMLEGRDGLQILTEVLPLLNTQPSSNPSM